MQRTLQSTKQGPALMLTSTTMKNTQNCNDTVRLRCHATVYLRMPCCAHLVSAHLARGVAAQAQRPHAEAVGRHQRAAAVEALEGPSLQAAFVEPAMFRTESSSHVSHLSECHCSTILEHLCSDRHACARPQLDLQRCLQVDPHSSSKSSCGHRHA